MLVPGAAAPKGVTTDMIRRMKPGSMIVDVAIAQNGRRETSHHYLRNGLNVHEGKVTSRPVVEALHYPFVEPSRAPAA